MAGGEPCPAALLAARAAALPGALGAATRRATLRGWQAVTMEHESTLPADAPGGLEGAHGLRGRRVLVVGASSGIGRAVAVAAAGAGARVVLSARRTDLLAEAADAAGAAGAGSAAGAAGATGTGAVAIPCDVSDEGACEALVAAAARAAGGIDAVVYAAGASPLVRLADATETVWIGVLRSNLLGAASVLRSALGHLREAVDPAVVLLSSHSVGDPWPGLGVYAASKAALDELARGLRAEEPWLRAVRVAVGPTLTGFADAWDSESASRAIEEWAAAGHLRHEVQQPEYVAAVVCDLLGDPARRSDLVVIGGSAKEAPPAG